MLFLMMTNARPNVWFPYQRPAPHARVRLFCLPYAGGGASIYRSWAEQLLPEIDVWLIQLPGHENRLAERPIEHLMDLVNILLPELLPYLDTPYAFFGHSMGAGISFELARVLCRYTCPAPVHLFVSGRRAPQVERRSSLAHTLPEPEFVETLRKIGGTPEQVLQSEELLQLLLPVIRSDFMLAETYTYQPGPTLSCPISAYGGLRDNEVTGEDLEAWQKETSGLFKVRMFPGNHFFLHSAQTTLLPIIARDLLSSI
jgi:medium-chain acyl-[acyl-carrier-protein] hydrolase